ncbi:peptide-methionine (R)-S-oxide reductase MsrB [Tahibacter amnicola]|uniref:Peptide methionine sulfoxide reductase MsrB n=1 Tax=Tahibacter amnicola TaxID=2976241 RepID=A0ABY6BHU6_9GAMM|nr:peptide-methionine (R)-S-oxide reductase MsrB [Tahibacter amnicola]UXI67437.1 peptide-methionine (R)-S-oxide reductase MsrB [Tahibacter amnicola]
MNDKVTKTDAQWREELTPEQYAICRCSATERAFTGKYWDHHAAGTYLCAACGSELFDSTTKYDSGSGWPSYWQPVNPDAVSEHEDRTHGMRRVEVRCARCDSHLGHVFTDGPRPTGLRYCINSAALDFAPK